MEAHKFTNTIFNNIKSFVLVKFVLCHSSISMEQARFLCCQTHFPCYEISCKHLHQKLEFQHLVAKSSCDSWGLDMTKNIRHAF